MTRNTIAALMVTAGMASFTFADGCTDKSAKADGGCSAKTSCGEGAVAQHDVKKTAEAKLDIVDTAAANKDFSTLVTAVKAAGLVPTLKGKGPFTVFAPTNAAFDKLPKETLAALLKPEGKEALTSILTYHVLGAEVKAADAIKLDGKTAKTVNGADVKIVVKDGKVLIGPGLDKDNKDMATVTTTDIVTSNGVIHVIDAVILPPKKDASEGEKKPAAPKN
jgi:uncharacterized surface protein with fasciclin (FAS1) repeats